MDRNQASPSSTPFRRTSRIVYYAVLSLFVIFVSISALNSVRLRYQLKIPWHYMMAEIDYSCVLLSYSGGGPEYERPFKCQFGRAEMDIEATIEKKSIMKDFSRRRRFFQLSFFGFHYAGHDVNMRGKTRYIAVNSYTLAIALFFPVLSALSCSRLRRCSAAEGEA